MIKDAGNFSMNYSYIWYPGDHLNKKPDTSFTYLLPGSPNHTIRIMQANSVASLVNKPTSPDFHATSFLYQLEDTICAARAETIIEALDNVKEGERIMTAYSNDRNQIRIEQKDKTIARYSILTPIKLLVEPGDNVVAGQPLAVLNKPADKYTVIFSVSYLDTKKLRNYIRNKEDPMFNVMLPLKFHYNAEQSNNTNFITSMIAHPIEIVSLEMSKKEKKKLGL